MPIDCSGYEQNEYHMNSLKNCYRAVIEICCLKDECFFVCKIFFYGLYPNFIMRHSKLFKELIS